MSITFRANALVVLVAACAIAVDRLFIGRTEIVAAAQAGRAAAPQYKVVRTDGGIDAQALENEVNAMAAQGWELQTVIPGEGVLEPDLSKTCLTFRAPPRPARTSSWRLRASGGCWITPPDGLISRSLPPPADSLWAAKSGVLWPGYP
jgi:hypothetical protein